MSKVLALTKKLVACPSITPNDANCQKIIADYLEALDFTVEHLPFGDVANLWARFGNTGPLFVFVGHTDVVPSGPEDQWQSPPFQPEIRNGYLYGRGTADMKGGIAAMLVAYQKFLKQHPVFNGSLAFLITSDEEGPSIDGIAKAITVLQARGETIDWALVGEPSSQKEIGDTIKNGRRGSLSGQLTVRGKQGHIAYPQLAKNPIHLAMPALAALTAIEWDQGNDYFPPTSFQISNIYAGTGATNVIPGQLEAAFNLRYSPEVSATDLQNKIHGLLDNYGLDYTVKWSHSAQPFFTPPGILVNACTDVIKEACGYAPTLSTSGGTSDGRFIAPTGAEVIELGVCNDTIHQINECVKITDLLALSDIYYHILKKLLIA